MNETDSERYMKMLNAQLEEQQVKNLTLQNQMGQLSSFNVEDKGSLFEYQLDLTEDLDRLHHLLQGHILSRTAEGSLNWEEPTDDRQKILSDYGVKRIMNDILFYLNKNTLLSCYDDETIVWKMKDFATEIADLLYNKYEDFFYYPTPEELFNKVKDIKTDLSDYELYKKCVQWSQEEMQSKLRHYPLLVQNITNAVHSTYLRALNGSERKSLRENWNNLNTPQPQLGMQQTKSLMKPSTW